MIIVTSDTDKLVEPGFDDFTIYDDGKVDVKIMDPEGAYYYALDVLKGRWLEAEEYIKREYIKCDPEWAFYYACYVLEDRWVEGEDVIKRDPKWAYEYAHFVIKSRWLEAEDVIKQNPKWWEHYEKDIL